MDACLAALPHVNALFNALSAAFLAAGYRAIRRREIERHRACMLAAFAASSLFLLGYLTRVALAGTHRFPGQGALRLAYLTLLTSHMVLAVVLVPLVFTALGLALGGRFDRHRRVARWTWPIWMYVSVTGVLVYVMLYQVAPLVTNPSV